MKAWPMLLPCGHPLLGAGKASASWKPARICQTSCSPPHPYRAGAWQHIGGSRQFIGNNYPTVLKDGLAAGKGVAVCMSRRKQTLS
ncbi:MAG: hypothetical protein ACLSUW_01050 [Akkermansia sp.]